MSEAVYKALAEASSGFVESPAGCGKTEAIVRTVGMFCTHPQLVLTHTHAGVDALRRRFREHGIPTTKYHVDTIAGWCWGWVRRYPSNGGYLGSISIAVWDDVYLSMTNLLRKDFIRKGIVNSYGGIIVDEYQDCTASMHQLAVELKQILPCRVLGDELQGIFGFGQQSLVTWPDVRSVFINDLGTFKTPHRWIKAGNEELGHWLLNSRTNFQNGIEPNYDNSPVHRRFIPYGELGKELIRFTHERQGKICVIGPKARPLSAGLETTLVNQGYCVLEPNELTALKQVIVALSDGSPLEKAWATAEFLIRVHGGLPGDDQKFIRNILEGKAQRPRRADRHALCQKHTGGTTPHLFADLIVYIERIDGASCKLRESVSALKCVLEEHVTSGIDLKNLYEQEITRRKHKSRSNVFRSIGSTLLVKGLEFDHAVILRDSNWAKNWGSYKDLYVALTRGAKTTTLVEMTN